jgi:hypothetical protein
MIWIEPCTVFYASLLGGMIGALSMAYVSRINGKEYIARVEALWSEDLQLLQRRIEDYDKRCECRSKEIVKTLSTISVNKPVDNNQKYRNNKGYKHSRHYTQGV